MSQRLQCLPFASLPEVPQGKGTTALAQRRRTHELANIGEDTTYVLVVCGSRGSQARDIERSATPGQWLKRSTRLAAPSALPPFSASSTAALSSPGGSAPASSEVAISV